MANDSFLNVNHDYKLNKKRQTFKPRQPEYELVVTTRGGQLLALNGYLFRLNYKRKDRIYWKCKTLGCLSSAVMSNKQELISFRENHNHNNDRLSIRNRSNASSLKRLPKPARRLLKAPTTEGLQLKFQDDQQSALTDTTFLQLEHAIKTEVVAANLISAYESSSYLPGINWDVKHQIATIADVKYGKVCPDNIVYQNCIFHYFQNGIVIFCRGSQRFFWVLLFENSVVAHVLGMVGDPHS